LLIVSFGVRRLLGNQQAGGGKEGEGEKKDSEARPHYDPIQNEHAALPLHIFTLVVRTPKKRKKKKGGRKRFIGAGLGRRTGRALV